MMKGQAERLMPLLGEVMAEAGADWAELAAIGVGTGPGSFTGARVSVAAARGLALGLGIPAIGVSLLEAGAFDVARPCRVVIERRGGEVAWQDFGPSGPLTEPQITQLDDLPPGPPQGASRLAPAVAIAHIAASRLGRPGPRPAPLYLRPADAAPARDRGPAIIAQ